MIKEFAKYMRYGKTVESCWTGNVYKLIENMSDKKETVKAVNVDNWRRYDLLGAWIEYWGTNSGGFRERFTGNIEECKAERRGYEEELKISDVKPHDEICFITPSYETKFKVKDLDRVSVNGTVARVAFLDETHFTFVDKISTRVYGGCFHICQFAELCESNGITVKPVASRTTA